MQNQPNQAPPGAAPGAIDVAPLIAKLRAGLPPQLQTIYDKAVLSGMRIMFDKNSFSMTMDALKQPGPLATRLSNGVIQLVYLLWTQSGHSLPPQIIVGLTATLALKAFEFVEMMGDPDATKDVMGEAVADAVQGVMDRFGATQDKVPSLVQGYTKQGQGAAPAPGMQPSAAPPASAPGAPAAAAPGGGMLDAGGQ